MAGKDTTKNHGKNINGSNSNGQPPILRLLSSNSSSSSSSNSRANGDCRSRPLSPDTEDNVTAQTEGIFRSFMYQRYQQDMADLEHIEQTPPLPELTTFQEPTRYDAFCGANIPGP